MRSAPQDLTNQTTNNLTTTAHRGREYLPMNILTAETPNPMDNAGAVALDLHDRGFTIIPLRNNPSSPNMAHGTWDNWTSASRAKLKKHFDQSPTSGVAVYAGDLFILDADTPESYAAMHEILNTFDISPNFIVRTARGEHIYLRLAEGVQAKPTGNNDTAYIDIRTGGSIARIAPDYGNKEILVDEIETTEDLPVATQELVDAVYRANGMEPPRKPEPAVEAPAVVATDEAITPLVRAALSYFDPDDREDYLTVGMACYHSTGGSDAGFQLFDEWAKDSDKYCVDRPIRDCWKSYGTHNGSVRTFGSLVHEGRARAEAKGESLEAPEAKPEPVVGALSMMRQASTVEAYDEMEQQLKDQVDIIPGLVPFGGVTAVVGKPNSAKTLWIMSQIMEQVESGRIDGSKIVYVNEDDDATGFNMKGRLLSRLGITQFSTNHSNIPALPNVAVLMDSLLEEAAAGNLMGGVLILDTLKKFANVMDKRGMKEIGNKFRALNAGGCTVLFLHHTNKNTSDDGDLIFSGVQDIEDDVDTMWILYPLSDPTQREQSVEIRKKKGRGRVVNMAAFTYQQDITIPYEQMLDELEMADDPEPMAELGAHKRLIGAHWQEMQLLRALQQNEGYIRISDVREWLITCRNGDDEKLVKAASRTSRDKVEATLKNAKLFDVERHGPREKRYTEKLMAVAVVPPPEF